MILIQHCSFPILEQEKYDHFEQSNIVYICVYVIYIIYVCILFIHICTCIYVYILYVCIYVYIRVYVCVYIYIYTYIYAYVFFIFPIYNIWPCLTAKYMPPWLCNYLIVLFLHLSNKHYILLWGWFKSLITKCGAKLKAAFNRYN